VITPIDAGIEAPPPTHVLRSAPGVVLRRARGDDVALECAVYVEGRRAEMAVAGWPDAVLEAFLADQFRLQSLHYARHYADADRWIVEVDGVAAGRLILIVAGEELRVVDVGLLPAFRGRGIGTALIDFAAGQAGARGLARIGLHVEPNNPARRLYLRLGFASQGLAGAYEKMERTLPSADIGGAERSAPPDPALRDGRTPGGRGGEVS